MIGVGEFDPEFAAEVLAKCTAHVSDVGFVFGKELNISTGPDLAVNAVIMWDGQAFDLLEQHERSSDLPSTVSVLAGHPRAAALQRALRMRGYETQETVMRK